MYRCMVCGMTINEKDIQVQMGLSAITKNPEDKAKIKVVWKKRPEVVVLCAKDKTPLKPLIIHIARH